VNSIADRLRRIVRPATAHGVGGPQQGNESEEPDPSHGSPQSGRSHMDPAAILDGEWTQAGSHRFLVVEGHRRDALDQPVDQDDVGLLGQADQFVVRRAG